MNIPLMDKRVRSLEEMMADLIAVSTQTSIEMAAFREEMQEDRKKSGEEMRQFREEMQQDRRSFKEEMREFKDSMASFKEEMRHENRDFNKKLGEIAHKQGRMAEDLVAPSICRILREMFHVPEIYKCAANVRYKQIHPEDSGRIKEFDVIAVCGDYVLVVETKSSPISKDVPRLLKTLGVFREYFPEHRDKRVFGGLAMLYADKSLIRYASRKGILVLAVGDELMDVMNEPGFKPAEF